MESVRIFEFAGHWLVRRRDTPNYHIYWCRPGTRRVRRRSTGTDDLNTAKQRLIEFTSERRAVAMPARQQPASMPALPFAAPNLGVGAPAPLLTLLAAYVERLQGRASYATAVYGLQAWTEFCTQHDIVYHHELTLPVQERFIAWRSVNRHNGQRLSNATLNRYLDVARAAMHDAWRRGEISWFPHVRLLPKPPPRDRFLSQDEVQRLLTACTDPHLRRFVLLGLHTLQRPSAILGLRVEQVDLAWNRINFLPPGRLQSNKRRPVIPITATLRPELEAAIAESLSGFIIEVAGRPIRQVKHSFHTACQRAGIPHATPGVLRHTGATLLAAAGVPLREVSGMLGHTTSRITEEVYAKRRPEFLAAAAKELDRMFAPTSCAPNARQSTGENDAKAG